MYLQALGRPQGDVGADIPLHAAVQALQRVRAIQEPCRLLVLGIDDRLTTPRPLGCLQALHKALRQAFIEGVTSLSGQEPLGEGDREVRILILVAAGQPCKAVSRAISIRLGILYAHRA